MSMLPFQSLATTISPSSLNSDETSQERPVFMAILW